MTDSKAPAEYYSSGSKRRKLSNDLNSSNPVLIGSDSVQAALAVEDPEPCDSNKTDKEGSERPDETRQNGPEASKAEAPKPKDNPEEKGTPEVKNAEGDVLSEKSPEPKKPVFGAASAFGSSSIFEKMKSRANVFDTPKNPENGEKLASKSPSAVTASPASSFGSFGGSFGANSVFSNALQKASQKKSFLDEPEEEKTDSPLQATQQYKQVELQEKTVTTGEENELSVFTANTKLFELHFSKLSDGWKERGVGPLHLNKALGGKSARLVMRSKGLLRVILNYAINPKTVFIKGLEASLSPGKFLRMNAMSEGEPVQYLLKFGNEELRNELFDKVELLKSELASADKVATPKKQEKGFKFIDMEASPGAHTDVDTEDEKKRV